VNFPEDETIVVLGALVSERYGRSALLAEQLEDRGLPPTTALDGMPTLEELDREIGALQEGVSAIRRVRAMAVEPGGTAGPIRIIEAPVLWPDISPACMVPLVNVGGVRPVMHRWARVVVGEGEGPDWLLGCGQRTSFPVAIRYDHARRFARHCQRCTRTVGS
jgi:hypothetical protein